MQPEKPNNLHDAFHLFSYREDWVSRDGRSIILRSITSKDKRIEKELIDGLSIQSSNYRFFHVIKEATEEMVNKYRAEESSPVIPDSENLRKMKCKVIEAHIANAKDYVRHNSDKLAKIVIDLVTSLKKAK